MDGLEARSGSGGFKVGVLGWVLMLGETVGLVIPYVPQTRGFSLFTWWDWESVGAELIGKDVGRNCWIYSYP